MAYYSNKKQIEKEFSWDKLENLKSTTPLDYFKFKKLCDGDSFILDIGCGYGRVCSLLEKLNFNNIYGADLSLTQLLRAKTKLKITNLLCCEALQLPYKNSIFDLIITFGVINCLIIIDELSLLIEECNRVLKPNGYWFINLYTRNDSKYFDDKYSEGLNNFSIKRGFESNSGILFRHYSILEIISISDPYFDLLSCELQKFKSLNQKRNVKGYSLILQKLDYLSKFR